MAANLPIIPAFFERAIERWADKRQSDAGYETRINRHRLYILPTRHGITYFLVLLLILSGSINYENSLGFMLTFLLGSLGFICMIYTHQNINQLKVKIGNAKAVFAGQQIEFPISISQSPISLRPAIELLSETGQNTICHLINTDAIDCKLIINTNKRGYVKVQRIKLYSEFPLGLFHAWSWLKFDSQCLVYPTPAKGNYTLTTASNHTPGNCVQNISGFDDFTGIRLYQAGDHPNHMAWKAIAKTGELQTKIFNLETADEIWINWSHTDQVENTEVRLSILCRLVLDASNDNHPYGLILPNTKILPDTGLPHQYRCLKALALYGLNE